MFMSKDAGQEVEREKKTGIGRRSAGEMAREEGSGQWMETEKARVDVRGWEEAGECGRVDVC